MFDLDTLPIHYDHVLGAQPQWRDALNSALRGQSLDIKKELYELSYLAPSAQKTLLAMFFYAKFGQVSYCVGPTIRGAFEKTRLGFVPEDSIRVPYPTFYIALPDCPWMIWGGPRTKWHPCGGIYVSRENEDTQFSVVMWGRENEHSNMVGDDATFWITLDLDNVKRVHRRNDPVPWLDIDGYLDTLLSNPLRSRNDLGIVGPSNETAQRVRNVKPLLRIVFALILYLGSINAELEMEPVNANEKKVLEKALERLKNPNKSRARRLRKQLDALVTPTVVWVGRTIESRGDGQPKGPRGAQKFHYRPGYFNHYWTGRRKDADGTPVPRSKQTRVRKWIEGYWVNPNLKDETDLANEPGKLVLFPEDVQHPSNEAETTTRELQP